MDAGLHKRCSPPPQSIINACYLQDRMIRPEGPLHVLKYFSSNNLKFIDNAV